MKAAIGRRIRDLEAAFASALMPDYLPLTRSEIADIERRARAGETITMVELARVKRQSPIIDGELLMQCHRGQIFVNATLGSIWQKSSMTSTGFHGSGDRTLSSGDRGDRLHAGLSRYGRSMKTTVRRLQPLLKSGKSSRKCRCASGTHSESCDSRRVIADGPSNRRPRSMCFHPKR